MDNTDDTKLIVFGKEMSREAIDVIITALTPTVQRVAEYGAIHGWDEDAIAAATSAAARGIGKGIMAIVDSHNVERGS